MSLTDDQLLYAYRNGTKIAVPYFGGQEVELFFEDEEELIQSADMLRQFMKLTAKDRLQDTPHIYAYFKDFTDDVGFEWVEDGMENLSPGSAEFWNFVYPTSIGVMESWDLGNRDQLRQFVVVEANCGWEEEHGLLMSWRDGRELAKVSSYDGHATNGHAYSDVTLDRWIYYSRRVDIRTANPIIDQG